MPDVQALLIKETNYGTCKDMDGKNGAGYFQLTSIGTAGVIEYIRKNKSEYANLLKDYDFYKDIPRESNGNELTRHCENNTERRKNMDLNTILGMIHIKMDSEGASKDSTSIVNNGAIKAKKMAKDQGLDLDKHIAEIQAHPERYTTKLKTFFSYNGNQEIQNEYAVFCVAAAEHIKETFYQPLLAQNTKSNTPATPDKQKVVEKS